MSMVGKPIVRFEDAELVRNPFAKTWVASVGKVYAHPTLGDCANIMTSRLERVQFDDDGSILELETKNTVYLKKDA